MSPAFTTLSVSDRWSHRREEFDVPTGLAFSGRSTYRRCGILRVSTTEGAPQRLSGPRSVPSPQRPAGRASLAYDPDDVIGVGIHTAGTARITTHGRTLPCAPGDVFVLDLSRPFTVTELDDFRVHLFGFPRGVLGLPDGRTDVLWGVHPRTGDGVVALLAPLLETIAGTVTAYPSTVAFRLAGTVADLLGTLSSELTASAGTGADATNDNAGHVDMARRIRAFVNQNLGDRSLRPEMIAAHHHVSVRHLHKVFVHEGTTLSRWIQQRRLEECRRELGRTGVALVSVSAVAKRWGFANSGHFSRQFRAVYGISPSDWHRLRSGEHGVSAPLPRQGTGTPGGHRLAATPAQPHPCRHPGSRPADVRRQDTPLHGPSSHAGRRLPSVRAESHLPEEHEDMTESPLVSRRVIVAAGAAVAVGAATAGPAAAPAQAAADSTTGRHHTAKPTIVLVHGAFADGSSWGPVTEHLQQWGFTVRSVANPLRGLPTDAAHLRSVLATIPGPVVLAGHSYGGAVITEAAAGAANVKALVYIAAFVPDAGEVLGELSARFPGSLLDPALSAVPAPGPDGTPGLDLYIRADRFHPVFCQDVSASTARELEAVQRPVSASAFGDRATAAAWRTIPSWNLVATRDRGIVPELQRFQAKRAGSHAVEVPSSHLPLRSHPGAVAELIRSAARSVPAPQA